MYEFLSQNALYVVLIIVMICWIGIFSYLMRLDRRILSLEKEQKGRKDL
ncbi:MAG: CcmD family protein [Ignavibacteriae bacterium]|nr:CcmD family protein [Ignavibacteriota bacterium]